MDLYITALLSLLVLLLIVSVFYLYKQINLLLVKVNKLAYDVNLLQKGTNEDVQNVFGNMDMMNNFMSNLSQEQNEEQEQEEEEELDEEESDDEELEVSDDEELEVSDDDELEEVSDDEANEELDNEELVPLDPDVNNNLNNTVVVNKTTSKNVPDNLAKNFDIGYKSVSTNDGFEYEVTSTKNGVKRWRKLSK